MLYMQLACHLTPAGPKERKTILAADTQEPRVHKMVATERTSEVCVGGVMQIETALAFVKQHMMQYADATAAYCITATGRDSVTPRLELALNQPTPQSGSADSKQLGSLGLVTAGRV